MANVILEGSDSDETRRLIHQDNGFGALIPGHPLVLEEPGDTPADMRIRCKSIDVELSFLFGEVEGTTELTPLAVALAQARATNRAPEPVAAARVSPRPKSWNVDAAAGALYSLGDRRLEQQLVLLKETANAPQVAYRAALFDRDQVTHVSWAAFRAALSAGMSWGGTAAAAEALWPVASSFWEPGDPFRLRPERENQISAIAERLSNATGDLATAVKPLLQLGQMDRLATLEVSAGELAAARDMVMPRRVEGAEALVEGLDEVHTVHDLRGWAEQMLRALLRLEAH